MNNIDQIINIIFERCKARKIDEYQIGYSKTKNNSVYVYEGKLDKYNERNNLSIQLKVKHNGKMGKASIENFSQENIDFLINEAIDNAKFIDTKKEEFFYDGSGEYKKVIPHKPLDEYYKIDKLKYLLDLEKHALSLSDKVKKVTHCCINEREIYHTIKNSLGLNIKEYYKKADVSIDILVSDNEKDKTNFEFAFFNDNKDLDPKNLAEKVVKNGLKKLNPVDINPKFTEVILNKDAASNIFGRIIDLFNASRIQKGTSKLAGKLNKLVASEKLTLIDDPHIKNGYLTAASDSEGVPTQNKKLIENGILKTYLYNLKTAKIDNVKPNGNGGGGNSIVTFNTYVELGSKTKDDLLKELNNGIIIDHIVSGQGFNDVSGDFSLEVFGFNVKDGKEKEALNPFIISGNIFDLLFNIKEIANDLEIEKECYRSPSMLVSGITISDNC
jgi:PmbA protein